MITKETLTVNLAQVVLDLGLAQRRKSLAANELKKMEKHLPHAKEIEDASDDDLPALFNRVLDVFEQLQGVKDNSRQKDFGMYLRDISKSTELTNLRRQLLGTLWARLPAGFRSVLGTIFVIVLLAFMVWTSIIAPLTGFGINVKLPESINLTTPAGSGSGDTGIIDVPVIGEDSGGASTSSLNKPSSDSTGIIDVPVIGGENK